MFRTPKEVKADIAALTARVVEIVDLVKSENRDCTDAEKQEIDAINGTSEKSGKLDSLHEEHDRSVIAEKQKFRAQAISIAEPVINQRMAAERTSPEGEDIDVIANIKIPARARRAFNSSIFSNEREAYASGQWLLATLGKNTRAKNWCIDNGIMNSMSEGVNSAGGFLVPDFYETSIIRVVESYGVFRQNSYVYPMGSDTVKVPRRSSGFTVYYVGENAAITASDMSFSQVQLVARKPSILTQISSELNEDEVVGLASLLTQEFGYALAVAEDAAGFLGDGTSTYGGIVGLKNALAAGSIYDAVSGNTAFSTLDLADFNKCKGKLPQYVGAMNKWYISKQGFAQSMELLAAAAGGNTMGTIAGGMGQSFLGDPVVFTQSLPVTDQAQVSTIVAYYGDLRMATTMGVRRAMRIDSDSSYYFNQDAIAVRCTERYDIVVHEPGTASVCGPIVALKTAAS